MKSYREITVIAWVQQTIYEIEIGINFYTILGAIVSQIIKKEKMQILQNDQHNV